MEVEEWCYLHYYRIIGEKLVLACDRIIYLINLKDGQIIWKKNDYLPEEYYISIASSDEMLFIACDSSCVAIDLEDGSKVWEVAQDFAGSSGFRRSMAYSSDKLVIYSNGLFCFDANNGKMLWSREMSFDSITKNSMVMDDERVYVDDLRFNQISAVDLSTGKTIWTTSYSLKYSLAYPLLLKGDYLFLQGYGVFDSTTGKLLWSDWYKNYDKSIIVGNVLLSHMDTRCSIFAEEYTYTSLRARDVRNAKVLWCKDIKNTNWNNNLWLMNDNKIYYDDLVSTSCIQPAANKISFNIGSDKGIVDDCLMISMDTKPVIYQNRSFLPAKYVVESLGGFIEWNSDERKVECKLVSIKNPNDRIPAGYNEHVVELWIDKPTAKVNGVETQIDPNNPEVVPTIIDGRTMVPMRFLAESLGCEVEWIAETKEIVLTYTN
ncbi:MAG TPA: PQQ-binding-like beta-propeller repeat protein [Caldisericia bacterium]|nr:PQQ-binding-like beta-propeller repeat protein [Caldisericia bacterium]HPQ92927.1 PQQ-binding-like beta-propeller repeat protein [Caldisericia bacterium]HRV73975.1 PQQ-binding-like beta-propeller repeat protein [Caldisericia bacterium]